MKKLRFCALSYTLTLLLPSCHAVKDDSHAVKDDSVVQLAATQANLDVVDLTPTALVDVTDQRNTPVGVEGIDKLFDNDPKTSTFLTHQDEWFQYRMQAPSILKFYKIYRADTNEDRVPTKWIVEGSVNGIVWTVLDSQSDQSFMSPSVPNQYDVSNNTAYLYYRLNILDNHTKDNDDTQLAEFRIYGERTTAIVPGTVSNVTTSVHSNAVSLTWLAASNATGYYVQRLGDDGVSVIETETTDLGYVDRDLAPNASYVYQIQAHKDGVRGLPTMASSRATTASVPSGLKDITALSSFDLDGKYGPKEGDEGIAMLADNDPYTKYYQGYSIASGDPKSHEMWMVQRTPADAVVTQYTLTSANDEPSRDPRAWQLEGSEDGVDGWTVLDARKDQSFLTRHQSRVYACNQEGRPFAYYRLTILMTQKPSATEMQLAEWRLFGSTSASLAAPAAPSDLQLDTTGYKAAKGDKDESRADILSSNQIGLRFADNAGKFNPESGVILERASDAAFTANLVSLPLGPNSSRARLFWLSPDSTYYFRVKAVNAAGSSSASATLSLQTKPDTVPAIWHETGWYGHWDRDLYLTDVDDSAKVRVYFDEFVPNRAGITWVTPVMGAVWSYMKRTYGDFSDPYLYVVGNASGPGYGGGGAANLLDRQAGFRNVPWGAADNWSTIDWTSWGDTLKFQVLTHELGHVVEGNIVNNNVYGTPGSVWEDSWWSNIFQYDLYASLPSVFPDRFRQLHLDNWLQSRGDTGWYWLRDWYLPLYEGRLGNTGADNKGTAFLVKYFRLLAQNMPSRHGTYVSREFTMGDFIHFCSGAAGVDLTAQAKIAFTWTPLVELQLARAQNEFPAVSALYRGNLAPGFTVDPIKRLATKNVALSGQTLAGAAADPNPNDRLTYEKLNGPSWLTIASDGTLVGTPTASGTATAEVRVTDPSGLVDTATLVINVTNSNCVAESDPEFCTRVNAQCGSVTASDNCDTTRTVSCGSCSAPKTCGGGGVPNQCAEVALLTPCSGICSNPVVFSSQSYNSGSLGTTATCHETTANLQGAVCGQFVAARSFSINGATVSCDGGSAAVPVKRNGGYCFQVSAGDFPWAYFQTY